MFATAVGGAKQNSSQMNAPPQLLIPCAWTVHPLEGRLHRLPRLLQRGGLGAVTPRIVVRCAVAVQ